MWSRWPPWSRVEGKRRNTQALAHTRYVTTRSFLGLFHFISSPKSITVCVPVFSPPLPWCSSSRSPIVLGVVAFYQSQSQHRNALSSMGRLAFENVQPTDRLIDSIELDQMDGAAAHPPKTMQSACSGFMPLMGPLSSWRSAWLKGAQTLPALHTE